MLLAKDATQCVWAPQATRGKCYYCPACGERVILRQGKSKISHFAHFSNSRCIDNQEGETYEHLLGKQQIFEWALKNEWQPELEVYLPEIKQRADLLVTINGKKVAIEFQCSSLKVQRLKERNQGYSSLNYKFWWILGSRYQGLTYRYSAQKFMQFHRNQLFLPFWNTSSASVKKIKYQQRRPNLTSKQTLKDVISLKRRAKFDPDILKLLEGIRRRGYEVFNCPLLCHLSFDCVKYFSHGSFYWQLKACLWLEKIPIFTAFELNDWYETLWKIDLTEWNEFPCTDQRKIAYYFLHQFTNSLMQTGWIKLVNDKILILSHPQWFKTAGDKYRALARFT